MDIKVWIKIESSYVSKTKSSPNFFDLVDNGDVNVFRSFENLRWIYQGVSGYDEFFKKRYKDFTFDLKKYITCG